MPKNDIQQLSITDVIAYIFWLMDTHPPPVIDAKNLESLGKGVDYLENKAFSLLGNDHGAVVFFRSLGFG
ncbi:hypothetical protein PAECIP111891_03676 [Paenibacillus allorhizoplanae]|uniref:Uncharacterized protein n=1 Tax=Paenibacillus allorhizoplanae TaxID=2905648 RepID=A0ABM9CGV0_9BACL|nr:hypothetical protein [Paenibacillus allorhizoplanae]CAH1211073.1 hypothetical protein PAECIP111891_03676 [Paenibacillus allorhizoplanae]